MNHAPRSQPPPADPLDAAARSIAVFGVYMLLLGAAMYARPDFVLTTVALPSSADAWPRLFGLVVGVVGSYYWALARQRDEAFFRATVWGRALVAAGLVGLVAAHLGPGLLTVAAFLESLGALWTALCLGPLRRRA